MLSMRIAVATLALFGVVALAAEKNERIEAVALITGPSASGNVTFIQNGCGEMVHVKVYLTGLSPGKHGFHVHEKGDLTNGCTSTGGHYNPEKVDHAGRHDESRHVGDLGNVEANSLGVVDTVFSDRVISLNGKYSIIGRAVVVHDGEDDEGKTTHPDSKKTGNAGGRAGCGIIGVNPYTNFYLPPPAQLCKNGNYHSATSSSSHSPSRPNRPTFYVPHDQPREHVIYPLLSSAGYSYPPYANPYQPFPYYY